MDAKVAVVLGRLRLRRARDRVGLDRQDPCLVVLRGAHDRRSCRVGEHEDRAALAAGVEHHQRQVADRSRRPGTPPRPPPRTRASAGPGTGATPSTCRVGGAPGRVDGGGRRRAGFADTGGVGRSTVGARVRARRGREEDDGEGGEAASRRAIVMSSSTGRTPAAFSARSWHERESMDASDSWRWPGSPCSSPPAAVAPPPPTASPSAPPAGRRRRTAAPSSSAAGNSYTVRLPAKGGKKVRVVVHDPDGVLAGIRVPTATEAADVGNTPMSGDAAVARTAATARRSVVAWVGTVVRQEGRTSRCTGTTGHASRRPRAGRATRWRSTAP